MAINIETNTDGDVTYKNPPVNRVLFPNITEYATAEAIEEFVNAWLDEHPEATTTVEDGSILPVKLDSTNEATDGYVLSYNATTGKFEWYDIEGELDEINSELGALKEDFNQRDSVYLANTKNLFNIFSEPQALYNCKVSSAIGSSITVEATKNVNYCDCQWFINVSDVNSVTISFESVTGDGSGNIRIGYSNDGSTISSWATFVTPGTPKTVDVSSYSYIAVVLYAVYESNSGVGHYRTFSKIQVENGTAQTEYLPARLIHNTIYDGVIENLDEVVTPNYGNTYNLFDPNFRQTAAGNEIPVIDGNTITITASKAQTYRYSEFIIDVRNVDSVIINYEVAETTGSDVTRIGYSTDGYTNAAWIRNTFDGDIVDVSNYNYLVLALYVAFDTAQSIGAYTTYKNVVVQNSENRYPYVSPESIVDNQSRAMIDYLIGQMYSDKPNFYYGERIMLTQNDCVNKCERSTWKEFKGADIQDITDYSLYEHQSLASFGDYIFMLQNGGGIVVLDYETKAIISTVTAPITTQNHQNAAQFSDIYYDEDDEFPLLFVSRCFYGDKDSCLIYRITRDNTTFTVTLVNTINIDITTYGGSWIIDNNTGELIFVGYRNGNYEVTEDNPTDMYVWRTPSKASIISGNTITLNVINASRKLTENNYIVLQDGVAIYGRLYLPIKFGTLGVGADWRIHIYDTNSGKLVSRVPMPYGSELEGITEHDEKLYVSRRDVTDTTGVHPVDIYEVAF